MTAMQRLKPFGASLHLISYAYIPYEFKTKKKTVILLLWLFPEKF